MLAIAFTCNSARRSTQCYEHKAVITGAHLPGRFGRDCNELPGTDGHLVLVHNYPPGSAQKDVEVFNAVINMVVADGLLLGRQLNLVDLKRRDAKTFADPFVEGTRRGVRAWPCGQ